VDFVQLRRILLAESAPDKVRANVFQLIVNLATDVEEWWPGMDMQKTEPEAVDSGTWSASIALLKFADAFSLPSEYSDTNPQSAPDPKLR
jgi:hypothetical protein